MTPKADLLLPTRDLTVLRALQSNMTGFATLGAASAIHSRFFALHYGIAEVVVGLSALLTRRLAT